MAWRRKSDKPLSEPMMVSLLNIYTSLGLNELTDRFIEYRLLQSETTYET